MFNNLLKMLDTNLNVFAPIFIVTFSNTGCSSKLYTLKIVPNIILVIVLPILDFIDHYYVYTLVHDCKKRHNSLDVNHRPITRNSLFRLICLSWKCRKINVKIQVIRIIDNNYVNFSFLFSLKYIIQSKPYDEKTNLIVLKKCSLR